MKNNLVIFISVFNICFLLTFCDSNTGVTSDNQMEISADTINFIREYYSDGKIKAVREVKHGKKNGRSIWYNRHGSVEAEVNYVDNVKHGGGYIYNYDEEIESYIYYDYLGRVMFRLDYENGFKESGTAFPEVFIIGDTIILGDEYFAEIHLIAPPEWSNRRLFIGEKVNNKVENYREVEIVEDEFLLKLRIESEGELNWFAVLNFDTKYGKKEFQYERKVVILPAH